MTHSFSVDFEPLSELGQSLLHDDVDGALLGGADVDEDVAAFRDGDGQSQQQLLGFRKMFVFGPLMVFQHFRFWFFKLLPLGPLCCLDQKCSIDVPSHSPSLVSFFLEFLIQVRLKFCGAV